jgi:hypothetical protein
LGAHQKGKVHKRRSAKEHRSGRRGQVC